MHTDKQSHILRIHTFIILIITLKKKLLHNSVINLRLITWMLYVGANNQTAVFEAQNNHIYIHYEVYSTSQIWNTMNYFL